jgi:ribosomal protein S27E
MKDTNTKIVVQCKKCKHKQLYGSTKKAGNYECEKCGNYFYTFAK